MFRLAPSATALSKKTNQGTDFLTHNCLHPLLACVLKHLCTRLIILTGGNNSTADTCKNCAKCGKGFKIGTNEDYNMKIKIRPGGISKILWFCSHANMAASDEGISLKREILEKVFT